MPEITLSILLNFRMLYKTGLTRIQYPYGKFSIENEPTVSHFHVCEWYLKLSKK